MNDTDLQTSPKPGLKWLLIISLSVLIFLVSWLFSMRLIQLHLTEDVALNLSLSLATGSLLAALYIFLALKFPEQLWVLKKPEPVESDGGRFTCYKCGNETTMENLFQKVKKGSFVIRYIYYCPNCYEGTRVYSTIKSFLFFVVAGLLIVYFDNTFAIGWIFLNLALFLLFSHIIILPHELGHAIVGKLLGMRVFRVAVGLGPVLFNKNIMGTTWEIKAIPLFGYTIVLNKTVKGFRFKKFFMLLGGISANIVMLLLIYSVIPEGFSFWDVTESVSPLAVVLIINWTVIISSLLPIKFNLGTAGQAYSDGFQSVKTLFMKEEEISKELSAYYAFEGFYWRDSGDNERAKEWYEKGISAFPESYFCKNDLGVLSIRTGDFERAKDLFFELNSTEHDEKQQELLLKNNLAYIYSLIGDDNELAIADRLSEEVYDNNSWFRNYKCTRGIVLIETGRIDEGLELIYEGIEMNTTPEDTASDMCHIAIGEFRRGNIEKGQEYYLQAKKLVPDCSILPFVEKEIGGLAAV